MTAASMSAKRFPMILALLAVLLLSACGFQLRGSNSRDTLPFKSIYVGISDASPLGIELRRYIRASDVALAKDAKSADAVIEPLSETREKVILSLNTQGLIREYALLYHFRFRVSDGQGKELLPPTQLDLKRNLSFNESQAIAKEKEEETMYRDMQSDVVQQILHRLARLKPAAES